MGYFKMKHVPASVSISIADWLRKHGHAVRPALTRAERAQLAECFALMDGDGSGAIDVDELSQAFHVLGLHVTKQAVRDLVARVDSDGSGEAAATVTPGRHLVIVIFQNTSIPCRRGGVARVHPDHDDDQRSRARGNLLGRQDASKAQSRR